MQPSQASKTVVSVAYLSRLANLPIPNSQIPNSIIFKRPCTVVVTL